MEDVLGRLARPDWCLAGCAPGAASDRPGLYEWRISGGGIYVGQYTVAAVRRRAYELNLMRLSLGLPYRKGKPTKFRPVHHALLEAVREGREVAFTILENHADKLDRNRREGEIVAALRLEAARGGPRVLNAESKRASASRGRRRHAESGDRGGPEEP